MLANVVPGFTARMIGPYFVHVVPYNVLVIALATIPVFSMLLIALTPNSRDGAKSESKS